MTWDAKLHIEAVKRLLEKHPISGAPSKHRHSGSIVLSDLHHHATLTHANADIPVEPDMLQLAHAFAAACLLLLTGRACAFTATTLFPFVTELLEEDLWDDDTWKEAHTTTAMVHRSSISNESTSPCWAQYIQLFLLKWWVRGSGEVQVSSAERGRIRDTPAENEVSMFQVVAYLSTFVRPLRSFLQQSLVLQLCLNGNLNTAIAIIRRFGNTVSYRACQPRHVARKECLHKEYLHALCMSQMLLFLPQCGHLFCF